VLASRGEYGHPMKRTHLLLAGAASTMRAPTPALSDQNTGFSTRGWYDG
jgi:hypothetical protein